MDDPQQQTQQTDPYAAIAQPLPKGAPDSSQADPYATIATPVAPDDKPDEQQPGFWSRAYETSGIKGLVDTAKARADADRQAAEEITGHIKNGRWGHALEGIVGHLGKQAASAALGPAGDIIKGNVENTYQKGKQAVQDAGKGDYAGAVADAAEAVPVVGPVAGAIAEPAAKDIKDKNWAGVAGDVVGGAGQLLSMKGAPENLESAADAGASAEAAIPKNPKIAGTELPRTVGQAASDANPAGIGADVKGVEDIARKIPGSGKLRDISTEQQGGARQVLADKLNNATQYPNAEPAAEPSGEPTDDPHTQARFDVAQKLVRGEMTPQQAADALDQIPVTPAPKVAATKTGGAVTSAAPESIEQNAADAADAARQAGSAKYEEIAQGAQGADFTKPVDAAHSILQDENIAKVLPKSARDALNKVASGLSEREEISQQIYGKSFNDLDTAKQAEVGKAMKSGSQPVDPFADILKARSEIGDAANGMKDAADRFQAHKALDQFDQAIQDALGDHDKANGTKLSSTLSDAKKLWSQKYAFETFRDGLQDLMRDQPHTGNREINGAGFQKLVNDLDPRGSKGKTPLHRMFPDDPQSAKDLHDLADFMGKNQGSAGGMASGMAKLRLLGLKESALGLIANTAGFSWLLSKPGLARNMLAALTAGKNVAKASAAIGAINHAASQVQQKADDSGAVPEGRIPVQAPDGNTYHFPDEESANRFKQAANIQ